MSRKTIKDMAFDLFTNTDYIFTSDVIFDLNDDENYLRRYLNQLFNLYEKNKELKLGEIQIQHVFIYCHLKNNEKEKLVEEILQVVSKLRVLEAIFISPFLELTKNGDNLILEYIKNVKLKIVVFQSGIIYSSIFSSFVPVLIDSVCTFDN
jgi:hypothetical protein